MRYEPLTAFLSHKNLDEIPMTFSEIEGLIGGELPASARRHRAWWSNNPSNSVITNAWLEAGYRSARVDMKAERLVFQRSRATSDNNAHQKLPSEGLPPFFGAMKGLMRIASGTDLTKPADPDWEG